MLSSASIARQPWPAELIVPSVYCCSFGAASAGNGTPNALFWPLADADAAADGAAADAAADGAAADAAADGAAADGAVEAAAGAHASSTAGAAMTPPTTTAERPMNERRVSFELFMFPLHRSKFPDYCHDGQTVEQTNRQRAQRRCRPPPGP